MMQTGSKTHARTALFWMTFPVLLLVTSVSGWLYMVSLAIDDPSFSVETDYYKKATNYDDVLAQRAQNERLGWSLEQRAFERSGSGAILRVSVRDGEGRALLGARLSGVAFATARGNQQRRLQFVEVGEGIYEARVEKARIGLWEVRLRAERELELYTKTLRTELALRLASGRKPS